jgi:hypothetical protein
MTDSNQRDELAAKAEQRSGSLLAEVWGFLRENKKWWLLPIVITMLLLGLLVALGGSGAAPFIYTLF